MGLINISSPRAPLAKKYALCPQGRFPRENNATASTVRLFNIDQDSQ